MNDTIVRISVLFCILLLLCMIYISASWGLADMYYSPAKSELRSWTIGERELNNTDWDRLRADLSKALELDPYHPKIHEHYAIAIEGRFSKLPQGDSEAENFRKQALNHYIKSVSLRPSWPYAWSNVMTVKFRLGQIDEEFIQALHIAETLGPWEPGIQKMVIDIGLITWPRLSYSDRSFVMKTISHALEKQPKAALSLVDRHGVLDTVCLINKDKEKIAEYCKQYKKK